MEKFQARFRKLRLDHNPLKRHNHSASQDISGLVVLADHCASQESFPTSHHGSLEHSSSSGNDNDSSGSASNTSATPTPPIAVPPPRWSADHLPIGNEGLPQDCPELSSSGRYLESNYIISPIEVAARQNKSLISFELGSFSESFRKTSQGVTVPRAPPQSALFPENSHNGNSGTPLFEKKTIPSRTQTEATRIQYDSITGQLKNAGRIRTALKPAPLAAEAAVTNAEPKDEDGLTPTGFGGLSKLTEHVSMNYDPIVPPQKPDTSLEGQHGLRIAPPLTADTGSSPPSEVLLTPPTNEAIGFCEIPCSSPISRTHSFQDPTSLLDISSWPRKLSTTQRNRSYNFGEQPPTARRRSRRTSDASASGASAKMSPASQFLGGWGTVRAPDPDAEGQEIGPYVIGKQVGYGGFSVVKEVTTIKNGIRIKRAAKVVRKKVANTDESENERIQAEFDREVGIWRHLAHPYILQLIEVYDTPFATYCFTRLTTGGTLFDLVRATNKQGLPILKARKYAYQLASAIRYLHEDVRIVHRDIKLENCLIDVSTDEEGSLLLCDFGMAEQIVGSSDDDSDSDDSGRLRLPKPHPRRRNTVDDYHPSSAAPALSDAVACYLTGSLQYASPELVTYTPPPPHSAKCKSSPSSSPDSPPHHSATLDMWAYGVVCFALHTGFLPFNHSFQPKLQMMIAKGEWDAEAFRGSAPVRSDREMGEDAFEVVSGCLEKDAGRRWRIGEVVESRWLGGLGFEEDNSLNC